MPMKRRPDRSCPITRAPSRSERHFSGGRGPPLLGGKAPRLEGQVLGATVSDIVVTQEEAAQVERLQYVLAHGCKEGLVERLADWPGAHCVKPLLEGTPVEGTWFSRTQEYAAAAGERTSTLGSTRRLNPSSWSHLQWRNKAASRPSWSIRSKPKPRPSERRPASLRSLRSVRRRFPGGCREDPGPT